jgi:hypothetical protein
MTWPIRVMVSDGGLIVLAEATVCGMRSWTTVAADVRANAIADLFGYKLAPLDTCRECVGDGEITVPGSFDARGEYRYQTCPICQGSGEAPPPCQCETEIGSVRVVPLPGGKRPDICCASCATTCSWCGRDAAAQALETGEFVCVEHSVALEPEWPELQIFPVFCGASHG